MGHNTGVSVVGNASKVAPSCVTLHVRDLLQEMELRHAYNTAMNGMMGAARSMGIPTQTFMYEDLITNPRLLTKMKQFVLEGVNCPHAIDTRDTEDLGSVKMHAG